MFKSTNLPSSLKFIVSIRLLQSVPDFHHLPHPIAVVLAFAKPFGLHLFHSRFFALEYHLAAASLSVVARQSARPVAAVLIVRSFVMPQAFVTFALPFLPQKLSLS